MGIYDRYILPRVVHFTCGQKPAMKQRQKIVPRAYGRVLEIGIGSGLNIPFYDPEKVEHLWGLDPSEEMWAIAARNAESHHLDAEPLRSGAEAIPLENNAADSVVITYTLCTIPDARPALEEIRRVLKPGASCCSVSMARRRIRRCASCRTWPIHCGDDWGAAAT